MADPSKPDETPQESEPPSEWESDNPNDVSFITGKRRKISMLRVPPDTLPTAPKPAESKPQETDAQTAPELLKAQLQTEDKNRSQGGTKWPIQARSATPQEREDAELRGFMPEQVRAEYQKADADQRKVIWEANKQAFAAAKKRKEQNLLREQKLMEKVFDTLQRVKEDADSHHLLPPADASTSDLKKWYEEMQKPVPPVPFLTAPHEEATQTEEQRRAMARILRATGRMPPERELENPYSAASWIMYGDRDRRKRDEEDSLRKREKLIARDERLLDAQQQRRPIVDDVVEGIMRPKRPKEARPVEPKPDPAVSDTSILIKFWKLTESNFFMGGGLGIALAAYAFLLGGAPVFAVCLLVCAWLVFSISVYRHRFFEGRERAWEIGGNIAISLVVAAVLTVLWLLLRPSVAIPISNFQPTLSQLSQPSSSPTVTMGSLVTATPTPLAQSQTPAPPIVVQGSNKPVSSQSVAPVPQPRNTKSQTSSMLTQARQLYTQRRFDDAVDLCDRVLSVDPGNREARALRNQINHTKHTLNSQND